MDKTLLVATTDPSRGTVTVYFAPRVGSAPWNSMLMEDGGVTGVLAEEQATDLTVWGGPTCHVPGGPSTRTGGKSTVVRVHWVAMLMVEEETEEMDRTLS